MGQRKKVDRVSNKKQVRSNRVINLLRLSGSMSRYDISKKTRYSPPVVTQIIEQLMQRGIVREIGKGDSHGGRKPILVELISEAEFIIGIDLGQRYTTGLLVDFNANIIDEIQEPSKASSDTHHVLESIRRMIETLRSHNPVVKERLSGIGIALPSLLELDNSLVKFETKPYLEFARNLHQETRIPIYIDNDAYLAALGEKWFGVGYGVSNFISVQLGEVIGAGIFFNDNFYLGSKEHSGSIGHSKVVFPGEPCHCGGSGCLETVAAGWAIAQKGQQLSKLGHAPVLTSMTNGSLDAITARKVAEAARLGEKACVSIFEDMALHAGRVIAASINLLNPEMVILGGRMSYFADVFFDNLRQSIMKHVMPTLKDEFSIEISTLKEKAGPLGACAMVLQESCESSFEEVLQLV